MRGLSGFVLTVLAPVLVALFFGLAVAVGLRKAWKQGNEGGDRPKPRAFDIGKQALSIFLVLFLTVVQLTGAYRHLRIHYDLMILKPEAVQEIDVGKRAFTDRASIARIVRDLQSSEWYSVNHGGWGDETPIIIRIGSGTTWQMRAGYHFSQQGAVVLRSSEPNGSGWALGEVFSATLPNTLQELGVPLSRCDTAHGRPCGPGSTQPAR